MRCKVIRWCAAVVVFGLGLLYPNVCGAGEPARKEALRYDGKPFEYWRDYMRTELKAERRIDALRALGAFGARRHAPEVAMAIVEMVKEYGSNANHDDLEKSVLSAAADAVVKIGPTAFEILIKNAKDRNVREFATEMFDRVDIPPLTPSVVQTLLEYALADEAEIRRFAVGVLGAAVEDNRPNQETLSAALQKMHDCELLVNALIKTLDEDSSRLNTNIGQVLKLLGKRAKSAAPALVSARLRYGVGPGEALEAIGLDYETWIPQIIEEGLNNPKPEIRKRAAEWLKGFGAKAEPAVPALTRCLRDKDMAVRFAAIDSLGFIAIAPGQVVPALARIVADNKEDCSCHRAAIAALRQFGPKAREAVPALLRVFDEDENREFRLSALKAVREIGCDPRQVMPHLIAEVEQVMEEYPQGNAIGGNLASSAFDYLLQLGGTKEALPVLIRAIKQYDHDERRPLIAEVLGQMGPAARDALPALREAAKAPNRRLRRAAAAAVKKIEGGDGN